MATQFPYFRFSSFQDTPGVLGSWFEYFEGLGVPCALVKHSREGRPAYAIWKIGREALDEHNKGAEPNDEELDGEVLVECNGFSERVSE